MTSKLSKLTMTVAVAAITGTGIASTASAAISELVVTSQRREQSIQNVPIAVSAFSAEQMDVRQINETLDVVRVIPNLTGNNNTGPGSSNSYYLRGLGNSESIATFDPPVSTYVDDVYIARQNANNYALFDVERIEVLRGPQGTTFGRNTTGGAVNVITRRPGEEFGGRIKAEVGSYDRVAISGVVDIPVSDKVLTKFAGYYIDDNGYGDNAVTGEEVNDENSWGVRGDVRLLLNDSVTWDLAVEQLSQEGTNLAGIDRDTPHDSNTTFRKDCGKPGNLDDVMTSGCGMGNDTETFSIYSNLQWDVSFGTIEFITGWRDLEQDFTLDFFPGPGYVIVNQGTHEQFTQEIKLNGTLFDDRLDYVAGLFYMDEDNETDFTDWGFGSLWSRKLENKTENISAYIQGDYAINDQWTFTLGARWTEEEKDIAFTPLAMDGDFINGVEVTADFDTSDLIAAGIPVDQKVSKVTPKIGIQYQHTDDLMFYASATNGFKSGGWNARDDEADKLVAFGPEEAWSYEIGMKGDFLDNTLRVNSAIFFQDTTDLQVPSVLFGTTTFVTSNVADLETWGVEVEAQYSPIDNLDLFASVGYLNAEYKNALPESQVADDVTGAITADPTRSPEWSVAVGGNYRIPLNNAGGDIVLGGDVIWRDEYWTATDNLDPNSLAESTTVVQARVGYENQDQGWGAFLECKNCTDEEILTSTLFGKYYFAEPRRVNFSVRLNF